MDVLYLLFSGLYIWGDADIGNNALKFVKPIPVWLMIAQLWSLRGVNSKIYVVIWGLAFGSLGDIFLLIGSLTTEPFFELGAAAFLIGHVLDVTAFVGFVKDLAYERVSLREVLSAEPLFIVMWLLEMTLSFWSIGIIIRSLSASEVGYMQWILAVYGSVLVLLTMAGFFFFFMLSRLSATLNIAGWLLMIGSLIFFASDNFLAHGKYDPSYKKVISPALNTWLIMVTYYVAQWMIGKGTFMVAVEFVENREYQIV